jgi:hypothetical protein
MKVIAARMHGAEFLFAKDSSYAMRKVEYALSVKI